MRYSNEVIFLIYHIKERDQVRKNIDKKVSPSKNKRWVVERTNSWHNRFGNLFAKYE